MTDHIDAETAIRRLADRVRGEARRGARRVRDNPRLRRMLRPTVSVILPVYNVEDYLAECLDSIAAQDLTRYELIVVDDGSQDGSRAIAEEYATRDSRIRIITRPNGGLGAARNTGVREARGTYLTFVDSDDKLPPHALAALVSTAGETGSQIVVGSVRRFDSTGDWRPEWTTRVHAERRPQIRLTDFYPLLRNLYTWNKLFRRDFFLDAGLWFREGVAYEDQPIITQLYLRAQSIDVIPEVVYNYRLREDQSSISQQTASLADLRARITAFELTRDALVAEADRATYLAWLETLFDSHLHWYLMSPGVSDDEYWQVIRDAVLEFTEDAPTELWQRTPPVRRVQLELARQDRRDDLRELVHLEADQDHDPPTSVTSGGVLLHLPFLGDPDLPEELFVMRPEQLKLVHTVDRIQWVPDDYGMSCRVTGWAYVARVDLAEHEQQVRVVLRDQNGRERAVASRGAPGSAYPPPSEHAWCDYADGTFDVLLPVEEILADTPPGARWTVHLEVTVAGFSVSAPVTRLLRAGSPGALTPGWLADGSRALWEWRLHEPLKLARQRAGVSLADVELTSAGIAARFDGAAGSAIHHVVARSGRRVVSADVAGGRFDLALPRPKGHAVWRLGARRVDDSPVDLVWPAAERVGPSDGATQTVLTEGVRGEAILTVWRLGAHALSAEVLVGGADRSESGAGTLRVTGRLFGGQHPDVVNLVAQGTGQHLVGPSAEVAEDGTFEAVIPMERSLFRFGSRSWAVGGHNLAVRVHDDAEVTDVPLLVSQELSDALPVPVETPLLEGRVIRGPKGVASVLLVRPVGEARGRYAQKRLELEARERSDGLTRGIMFRSYFGEQCTDAGLSIQAELRRRGSDLPVYWAVQSHAVPVPEGGIPVVVGSREWHQLLNSVAYYVDNMFQPLALQKREGQVIVETFHGYPFKQMGLPHWRNLGFPQSRIDSYAARAKEWDYLVSPASYATPLLCRDFLYDGEVLEIGYPRNDVLLSEEAPSIRATVRESLGIRDDQVAVLYAPTFRDYLSPDDNAAEMVDFFDFDAAYDALGDDYVILVRGHAFNARSGKRIGDRPGCIDVTDYPEISDLYLAADTAIVDYSSLRFDFGVTGKPMIFHVPDLQRYKDTRGWLFDFEPTAPGPLLDTTAEVVDAIADLAGVGAQYSAAYEKFRSDFLELEDGQAGRRFVDAVLAPRGDG